MFQTKLFKRFFFLLCVIGVLNLLGHVFYLFDSLWWFDVLLHFLAGGCVALGALFLLSITSKKSFSRMRMVWVGFLSALFLGIIWEMYELYFGITFFSDAIYMTDTIHDLVLDSIGGFLGSLYGFNLIKRNG